MTDNPTTKPDWDEGNTQMWVGPGNQPTQNPTTMVPRWEPGIRGDPEMLARLRAWAEPLYGHPIPDSGPGNLQRLQDIIEDAAAAANAVPQYRKST